jgi:hypothetical protein
MIETAGQAQAGIDFCLNAAWCDPNIALRPPTRRKSYSSLTGRAAAILSTSDKLQGAAA